MGEINHEDKRFQTFGESMRANVDQLIFNELSQWSKQEQSEYDNDLSAYAFSQRHFANLSKEETEQVLEIMSSLRSIYQDIIKIGPDKSSEKLSGLTKERHKLMKRLMQVVMA